MNCANESKVVVTMPSIKTSMKYIGLYVGLTGILIVLSLAGNISFTTFTITVAKKLHENMLLSLLHTKLSFFDTTP